MYRRNTTREKAVVAALTVAMLGSTITVMADGWSEEQLAKIAESDFDYTKDFIYVNEDDEATKNAGITESEKKAAKEERLKTEKELGYESGHIFVRYSELNLVDKMKEKGFNSIYDVIKLDLKKFGDEKIIIKASSDCEYLHIIDMEVVLNENKTVKTAQRQYESLGYVETTVVYSSIGGGVTCNLEVEGVYPIYNDDSVSLGCVTKNSGENTKYRWMYAVMGQQSTTWVEISDWSTSQWCNWEPDANESYTVVCQVSYNGDEIVSKQTVWYVDRPQMGKKVTGDCAMATPEGLLFGCTSNVTAADKDYLTTCYIYSYTAGTWVAQAPYQALGCSWFRISSLPKGTYLMYTCTEKVMPDGQKRKLSYRYYPFAL